ncbi:diacylglycerol kinase family protein [Candidatus Uhrbacteria bacterium]|jgi:diacylglycerol kinase|nr:diacylglycerol kinase family protein [Candidatus Uhrbacteria bacterium]
MISLHRLKQSLTHALRGVRVVFVAEQSFRLQVIAAIAVVAAGFYFQVTSNEFVILMLLIGAILSLEMINSIFERIVDSFKPRIHPIVKDIKDIMAGAVLVASVAAVAIGVTIFDSYILALVSG